MRFFFGLGLHWTALLAVSFPIVVRAEEPVPAKMPPEVRPYFYLRSVEQGNMETIGVAAGVDNDTNPDLTTRKDRYTWPYYYNRRGSPLQSINKPDPNSPYLAMSDSGIKNWTDRLLLGWDNLTPAQRAESIKNQGKEAQELFNKLDQRWAQLTDAERARITDEAKAYRAIPDNAGLATLMKSSPNARQLVEKISASTIELHDLGSILSYCNRPHLPGEIDDNPTKFRLPGWKPTLAEKPVFPYKVAQVKPEKLDSWFSVKTTEFGGRGDKNRSAIEGYREEAEKVVNPNRCECALPFNFVRNYSEFYKSKQSGDSLPAGKMESLELVRVYLRVRDPRNPSREVICLVNDMGPENIYDPYWTDYRHNGARPLIESGIDQFGTGENQGAGLDVTRGCMDGLGVPGVPGKRTTSNLQWSFLGAYPHEVKSSRQAKEGTQWALSDTPLGPSPALDLDDGNKKRVEDRVSQLQVEKTDYPDILAPDKKLRRDKTAVHTPAEIDAWIKAHPEQRALALRAFQIKPVVNPADLKFWPKRSETPEETVAP